MFYPKMLTLCLLNIFCLVVAGNVYEKGSPVTLNCSTGENQVQWRKNNDTVGSQKIYNVKDNSISFVVDKSTVGRYACFVGDVEIEHFDIMTAPIADPDNKLEKNAIYGETFVYDCKGFGNPQPFVTWLKDGEPLNSTNLRIILKDSHDLINGSLRINSVEYEDSGEYVCLASNQHGNFSVKVKVNVKDQFAALWPFFGICLEVVILCTIIFIYEKRRSKRAQEEQQKEEVNQLTSNNERAVDELRQRKV